MAKVWMVNFSGQDVEGARKFGELHILTEGTQNIFHTDRWVYEFSRMMADSEWADYILPTGSPILSIIACLVFYRKHKILNLLVWNAKLGEYWPRTVKEEDFQRIEEIIEEIARANEECESKMEGGWNAKSKDGVNNSPKS